MSRTAIAIAAAITGLAGAASTWAATPLSVRDSWRIGSSGTSFCSAQSLTIDQALSGMFDRQARSEEHTSELQSRVDLVCRLLLEKKKKQPFCTALAGAVVFTSVSIT